MLIKQFVLHTYKAKRKIKIATIRGLYSIFLSKGMSRPLLNLVGKRRHL